MKNIQKRGKKKSAYTHTHKKCNIRESAWLWLILSKIIVEKCSFKQCFSCCYPSQLSLSCHPSNPSLPSHSSHPSHSYHPCHPNHPSQLSPSSHPSNPSLPSHPSHSSHPSHPSQSQSSHAPIKSLKVVPVFQCLLYPTQILKCLKGANTERPFG